MTDALGYRAKFGVLGPSTNTIVQPDFDDMRPAGVTNHYSRIIIQNAQAISDESFMQGTLEIDKCFADRIVASETPVRLHRSLTVTTGRSCTAEIINRWRSDSCILSSLDA